MGEAKLQDTNDPHTKYVEEVRQKLGLLQGIDDALRSVGTFILHYQSAREDMVLLRAYRDELARENKALRSALVEREEARQEQGEDARPEIDPPRHDACGNVMSLVRQCLFCQSTPTPTRTPDGDALAEAMDNAASGLLEACSISDRHHIAYKLRDDAAAYRASPARADDDVDELELRTQQITKIARLLGVTGEWSINLDLGAEAIAALERPSRADEYADEHRRWYKADGSFEILDPAEVRERRKAAAKQLARADEGAVGEVAELLTQEAGWLRGHADMVGRGHRVSIERLEQMSDRLDNLAAKLSAAGKGEG